jgi:hypothetical protein
LLQNVLYICQEGSKKINAVHSQEIGIKCTVHVRKDPKINAVHSQEIGIKMYSTCQEGSKNKCSPQSRNRYKNVQYMSGRIQK